MVDRNGLSGGAPGIEAGLFAAVREIDHDAAGVEARDDFAAERREPVVLGHDGAVAELVARVVGELDDAYEEVGKDIDARGVGADPRSILETVDDADPALRAGAQKAVPFNSVNGSFGLAVCADFQWRLETTPRYGHKIAHVVVASDNSRGGR